MRELKFRVWSEEDREYRTDCDVFKLFHGKTGCPATIYNDEGDRFDIEQYTGLKDKNGKEIYEGDVIKCGPYSARPIVSEEGRYWLGDEPDDLFAATVRWDIEVIGNIHENADLLEEEKECSD